MPTTDSSHHPSNKNLTLSIIIVSYNTATLTIQAIQSAIAACTEARTPISAEILVIDNHSSDNSVSQLKALAKKSSLPITVIANTTNSGFAAANNQGIARAKGKYLLLLNSDTITTPTAFEKLLGAFQAYPDDDTTAYLSSYRGTLDRLGILAATLLNPDGTPQPQGGSFPSLISLFIHMTMLDDLPIIGSLFPSTQHTGHRATQPTKPHLHQKDWVAGTAMMIRRQVIEEIGDLDANIFMYGEDVEFCMRARQRHWDVAEHMGAKITHIGSASAGSERAIIGELTGYLYIWSKHKPTWQFIWAKMLILLGCHLRRFLFGTMIRNKSKAALYERAATAVNQV